MKKLKKLQNNFTTPEQSKRLLELGVPIDSADLIGFICVKDSEFLHKGDTYEAVLHGEDTYTMVIAPDEYGGVPVDKPFPCWSVSRLMEIYDTCFTNTEVIKKGVWPSFPEAKDYADSYVEYIIDTFETAKNAGKLDFSKLKE